MHSIRSLTVVVTLLFTSMVFAESPAFLLHAKRIVFLGDSITHAGHYVSLIELQMHLAGHESHPELINLGLPSETCSGLSEPIHPFPRPNVHERIDRALAKLKPDVVVACYGMNDGIYHPPSDERMAAYKLGINKIIEKVNASGAKLVLMTPPPFDPLPYKKQGKLKPIGADEYSWKTIYEHYDEVIQNYGDWVQQQAHRVAMVVDLHGPVTEYVMEKRKTDPDFSMSTDGVHVNHEGHETLAATILAAWGMRSTPKANAELLAVISKRQSLMHDAWLSEVGHKRPQVKPGLPIEAAKSKAVEMGRQIEALLPQIAK